MILIAWVKVVAWALGTALLGVGFFSVLLRRETRKASGLKEAEQFVAHRKVEYVLSPTAGEIATERTSEELKRWSDKLPVDVTSDEQRRLHNDARRFARLLISEIILKNEDRIAEGLAREDLSAWLKKDIDHFRELYDSRVKPEVTAKYDYFHHELVRILAEGNPAKLGASIPHEVSSEDEK